MTNIEHLRDILKKMELEKTDEALEFLGAIEEEVKDKGIKIESQGEYIRELELQLEEEPEWETIDLGLDELHFKLEKGNMVIKSKLERALNAINSIQHKLIQLR